MNLKVHIGIVTAINCLLILLWIYAALSKLLNFEQSKMQMMNQVFTPAINGFLLWAVPISELIIAGLLLSNWRRLGFLLSFIFLAVFSIYIALVMTRAFGRIPCSCGGLISELSWGQHLAFNTVFLTLALSGFFMMRKKGGDMGKG